MGHLLSLNGDVDGGLLCLAMTSSLIAALWGSNRGEGSPNSSSDVDDVGGSVSNCKHGIESEDETDKVGEAQERSEEKLGWVDVRICRKRQPERVRDGTRLRVVGGRWASRGADRRPF